MNRKELEVNLMFKEGREPGEVMVKDCRGDWKLSQEGMTELGDLMLEQAGMVQCGEVAHG